MPPRLRRPVPFLIACASALLLAAPAGAATFCVYAPDGCTGTSEPSLQAAIDAAAPDGGGLIRVGAGNDAAEPIRIDAGNAVTIRGTLDDYGSGTDLQVGGAPAGTAPVTVDEPGAVIEHVSLFDHSTGSGPVVDLRDGTLNDVYVSADSTAVTGVRITGGTLRDSTIEADGGTAVATAGGASLVDDANLYGRTALTSAASGAVVTRTLLGGGDTALAVTGGSLTVDDSYLEPFVYGGNPGGTLVAVTPSSAASVVLRSVTLDGAGSFGSGLRATCAGGAATADVTLSDSLAARSTRDVEASGAGCDLHFDHDEYGVRAAAAGGAAYDDGAGVAARPDDATLTETGSGLRPSWDAPARNAGARPVGAGETDFAGHPRVVDGARDLGAIEYQHVAPVAELDWAPISGDGAHVGTQESLEANSSDDDREALANVFTVDGAVVPHYDFPEDSSDLPGIPPTAALDGWLLLWTPTLTGVHHVALTSTDPSGLSSTASRDIAVGAALPRPVAPGPPLVVPKPPVFTPIRRPVSHARRPALYVDVPTPALTASGRLPVRVACGQKAGCSGALRVLLMPFKRGAKPVKVGSGRFTRLGYAKTKIYNIAISAAAGRAVRKEGWKGRELRVVAYKGSGTAAKVWAMDSPHVTWLKAPAKKKS